MTFSLCIHTAFYFPFFYFPLFDILLIKDPISWVGLIIAFEGTTRTRLYACMLKKDPLLFSQRSLLQNRLSKRLSKTVSCIMSP